MARLEPVIRQAQGELAEDMRRRLQDPVLLTSLRVRIAIILGIAFLMTVKPTFIAAVVVIVLAASIGWLAGRIPMRRTGHELRSEIG
jgi:uncharacterized membrane protein